MWAKVEVGSSNDNGIKKEKGESVSTLRAAFNCSSSSRGCDVELWTDRRRSISSKDEGCQVLKGKVGSCFFALEGFRLWRYR